MEATKDSLTAQEMQLLKLYRELDTRRQAQVIKAAQALKATAEMQRNPFAL